MSPFSPRPHLCGRQTSGPSSICIEVVSAWVPRPNCQTTGFGRYLAIGIVFSKLCSLRWCVWTCAVWLFSYLDPGASTQHLNYSAIQTLILQVSFDSYANCAFQHWRRCPNTRIFWSCGGDVVSTHALGLRHPADHNKLKCKHCGVCPDVCDHSGFRNAEYRGLKHQIIASARLQYYAWWAQVARACNVGLGTWASVPARWWW